jgi:hypothetical protein
MQDDQGKKEIKKNKQKKSHRILLSAKIIKELPGNYPTAQTRAVKVSIIEIFTAPGKSKTGLFKKSILTVIFLFSKKIIIKGRIFTFIRIFKFIINQLNNLSK